MAPGQYDTESKDFWEAGATSDPTKDPSEREEVSERPSVTTQMEEDNL